VSSPLDDRRCVHFHGIQHKTCAAGVHYSTMRGRLPCIARYAKPEATCALRELETHAAAAARRDSIVAAMDAAFADVAAGRCHVCQAAVEPSTRHGRCLYAACGHRVGQVAK
jgi:hypothetical protein